MSEDGIWVPRAQQARRPQPLCYSRPCLGELVQIDGCDHEWFEDRGPRRTGPPDAAGSHGEGTAPAGDLDARSGQRLRVRLRPESQRALLARAPDAHDSHRPVRDEEEIALRFTWQEERNLTRNLTLRQKDRIRAAQQRATAPPPRRDVADRVFRPNISTSQSTGHFYQALTILAPLAARRTSRRVVSRRADGMRRPRLRPHAAPRGGPVAFPASSSSSRSRVCNLRCQSCPVTHFERLLFYNFGDPFLHPDAMGALLRACARHGDRDRAPSSDDPCSSSGTTRTRRFAKRWRSHVNSIARSNRSSRTRKAHRGASPRVGRLSLLSSPILLVVRV